MSEPGWTVLLIGGGAGTGKTTLSLKLAEHFGVTALEGDLFYVAMRAAIAEEKEPDLYVYAQPNVWQKSVDELVAAIFQQGRPVLRGLEAVLARHASRDVPLLMESVLLFPEFAGQETFAGQAFPGRVKSLFLYEPDIEALRASFDSRRREPWDEAGEKRLVVAYAIGMEIKRQAEALGLPVLESRPFDTLLDRALVVLDTPA